MENEMPLSIGFGLTVGLLFVCICGMAQKKLALCKEESFRDTMIFLGFAFLALFFSSIFCPWDMLASYSQVLAKLIGLIQFQWRYIVAAIVFLVFAIIFCLNSVEEKIGSRRVNQIILLLWIYVNTLDRKS